MLYIVLVLYIAIVLYIVLVLYIALELMWPNLGKSTGNFFFKLVKVLQNDSKITTLAAMVPEL